MRSNCIMQDDHCSIYFVLTDDLQIRWKSLGSKLRSIWYSSARLCKEVLNPCSLNRIGNDQWWKCIFHIYSKGSRICEAYNLHIYSIPSIYQRCARRGRGRCRVNNKQTKTWIRIISKYEWTKVLNHFGQCAITMAGYIYSCALKGGKWTDKTDIQKNNSIPHKNNHCTVKLVFHNYLQFSVHESLYSDASYNHEYRYGGGGVSRPVVCVIGSHLFRAFCL